MADQRSREEEEYFAKQEYEKRRVLAERKQAEMAAAEREKLRALHHMHCPKCGGDLLTVALHGVEVDQCPSCQGLWLDAGELEQLTQRGGDSPLKKILDIFKS